MLLLVYTIYRSVSWVSCWGVAARDTYSNAQTGFSSFGGGHTHTTFAAFTTGKYVTWCLFHGKEEKRLKLFFECFWYLNFVCFDIFAVRFEGGFFCCFCLFNSGLIAYFLDSLLFPLQCAAAQLIFNDFTKFPQVLECFRILLSSKGENGLIFLSNVWSILCFQKCFI